ncbi:gliding motility-associated C-terminal domain-containing protein [Hymenobacter endophyticus]
MDRQGGLGEVVRRDVLLHPTSTERVAAVPHANGRDLWVIGHERDTDVCFVYLLTAQGVVSLPVLSRDGFVHQRVQAIGQLKASPNGRRLALAAGTVNPQQTQGIPSVELLDFDPATGRISNPVVLPPARIASYGVEFSPDGTRLYVTDPFFGALFQYDLTAANIGASVVPIPVAPGQAGSTPSALQLGPDGRIYVALTNTTVQAVSVITEPNSLGTACAYINQGVSLNGRRSALGLPSYVQRDLWHFTLKGKCQNSPIAFAFPASYAPDSVRWDFGDPASGPRNLSSLLAPTHTYSAPGRYLVSLTLSLPGGYISTLRRYVDVFPLPQVNIGRDTSLCPGSRLTLNATTVGATYRWQDGSTTATITTDRTGWYWVDVTSAAGCTTRDSLRIRAAPVPRVRLGADTVLCVGTSVMLQPRLVELGTRYRWQNGVTTSALIVNQPGIYWVEGTNGAGCSTRDSVRVFYLDPPTVYLGRDTTLCSTPEQPFMLDATLPGVRYRWQDGSTGATFTPDRSGRYWVRVSTDFCSATDTILVRLYECRQSVFVPNIITPNGDGKNDALQVTGLGTVPWSLVIYNRWGKQVYETSNYQQNWSADGLADGTYFYLLRHAQSTQQVKGWVEVLR